MIHNRDISWLGFNFRVLQEASDKRVPLYERMKFLAIFSSNLDEFFRVRYPSVVAFSKMKGKTRSKASVVMAEDTAEKIQNEINRQLRYFASVLTEEIIPALKANGINFYYNSAIQAEHQKEIKEIFLSDVLAFIQPIFLEAGSQSFQPENNQLYFVVTLKEPDHGILKQAIVNIPSEKVKRFFTLTPLDGEEYVIFLDDIIRENLHLLFPKLTILSVYSVKLNRDAELNLQDEYSGNLLTKIEKQLKKRDIGLPCRFEFESGMPRNLQLFLMSAFNVKHEEMFMDGRYHNLSDLSSFPSFQKELNYKKMPPLTAANIADTGDIFHVLEQRDLLLHLPYQSYNPVLSFFNQAAVDADVTDIYITLYRLASDSHIGNALISAAKNGKNVIVFIELKARFDEANNIQWSRMMEAAGVKLVYSLPQIKVHSKTALVKKKVDGHELSYAILSTGNFNEETARFYTDHVLMTSDTAIIRELVMLFKFLEKGRAEIGDAARLKFSELLVSQFNLVGELEKRIGLEIKKAKKGLPAHIRIKVNNLEEPGMIKWLYKASKAGVKVDLIVRSVCCVAPGIEGISENITVRRIVDRFLEHTRLFIFGAGDDALVYIGSADLMTRNLYHRVEVCVPLKEAECRKEILDYFNIQWMDNDKAVQFLPDQQSVEVPGENGTHINAQQSIYQYLQNAS